MAMWAWKTISIPIKSYPNKRMCQAIIFLPQSTALKGRYIPARGNAPVTAIPPPYSALKGRDIPPTTADRRSVAAQRAVPLKTTRFSHAKARSRKELQNTHIFQIAIGNTPPASKTCLVIPNRYRHRDRNRKDTASGFDKNGMFAALRWTASRRSWDRGHRHRHRFRSR